MIIKTWEKHFEQMNHSRLQELIRILRELKYKDQIVWLEFEELDQILKIAVIVYER